MEKKSVVPLTPAFRRQFYYVVGDNFCHKLRYVSSPVTCATMYCLRTVENDAWAIGGPHNGGRAFAVAGPSTWNSLSKRLRDPSSSSAVFARLLKTFLFSEY